MTIYPGPLKNTPSKMWNFAENYFDWGGSVYRVTLKNGKLEKSVLPLYKEKSKSSLGGTILKILILPLAGLILFGIRSYFRKKYSIEIINKKSADSITNNTDHIGTSSLKISNKDESVSTPLNEQKKTEENLQPRNSVFIDPVKIGDDDIFKNQDISVPKSDESSSKKAHQPFILKKPLEPSECEAITLKLIKHWDEQLGQRVKNSGGLKTTMEALIGELSPEGIIQIAFACAEKKPRLTIINLQEFNIADQEALFQLADICVRKDSYGVGNNIKNFKLKSSSDRLEIFKLYLESEKSSMEYISNVKKFKIVDQVYLFEFAKKCAEENWRKTLHSLSSFGLKEEAHRLEILKIIILGNKKVNDNMLDDDFHYIIEDFGKWKINSNQAAIIEIVKFLANRFPKKTCDQFGNFGISDQKGRFDIAKALAVKGRFKEARLILSGMWKKNDRSWNEKLLFYINHEPDQFIWFAQKMTEKEEKQKSISDFFDLDQDKPDFIEKGRAIINEYLNVHFQGLGFNSLTLNLEKIKDVYAKKKALQFLGEALFVLRENLDNEQLKWIKDNKLLDDFFVFRSSAFRLPLMTILIPLNEKIRTQFSIQSSPVNLEKKHGPLLRFALAKLIVSGLTEDTINAFVKNLSYKEFKDQKKFLFLVNTLQLINDEPRFDKEDKNAIFHKLSTYQGKDLYNQIFALNQLLKLSNGWKISEQVAANQKIDKSFEQLSQESFCQVLPIQDVKDFSQKMQNTFLSSRMPDAIYIYANNIKKLNDHAATACLANYVKEVLDGTFIENRYSQANNEHLEKIFKNNSEMEKKWRTPLEKMGVNKSITKKEFSLSKWIKQKIEIDKHADLKLYPELKDFLDFNKNAIETNADPLSILREINKLNLSEQFKRDVESQIQKLTSTKDENPTAVFDIDDPFDLLLCGTEVPDSCQAIDGSPAMNKGLLGYLADGKNRLLAVKDNRGKILTRALLKILFDGEKPVLFLERVYGSQKAGNENAIREMAIKKAQALNIPLLENSDKGKEYGRPIEALGGPAPYEYSDATAGIEDGGKFVIQKASVIWMPS